MSAEHVSASPLAGQVAIVTGAARGIGQAIAVELAGAGAQVVAVDLAPADETLSLLGEGGHSSVALDIQDVAKVQETVRDVVATHGRLDILVNNAGTASRHGLDGFSMEDWTRDIDTNLRGTFAFCQAAIHPHMVDRGYGRIVNISSISGIMGGPRSGGEGGGRSGPAYAASKGGVIALTKWLAKEYGTAGITVNSVAPGPIATAMTGDVEYDFSQQFVPRMGTPEEIAAAVGYLVGQGGGFVTGQVLRVCGGAAVG